MGQKHPLTGQPPPAWTEPWAWGSDVDVTMLLCDGAQEVREGHHDMIVTGSSQALGPLRHYIMADLTRSILNLAVCPVLVARGGGSRGTPPGMWNALKRMFTAK